jgi:hypothetical protein
MRFKHLAARLKPEEKFTFAVCAVALVIVIAEVWFE